MCGLGPRRHSVLSTVSWLTHSSTPAGGAAQSRPDHRCCAGVGGNQAEGSTGQDLHTHSQGEHPRGGSILFQAPPTPRAFTLTPEPHESLLAPLNPTGLYPHPRPHKPLPSPLNPMSLYLHP